MLALELLFTVFHAIFVRNPLSVPSQVFGGVHTPEVAGLYQESEDKMSFFQVEPEQFMSKITFHTSGCGWVVSENLGNYKPPVIVPGIRKASCLGFLLSGLFRVLFCVCVEFC